MNTSDQIVELTRRWYNYVSLDHHKDRDCHFYVEKKWSYGQEPVYMAHHDGYRVRNYWHSQEFSTAAEAEEALLKWLTHTINGEIMFLKDRLNAPEEDWMHDNETIRRELDALEGK
jgi:hypothetical protein